LLGKKLMGLLPNRYARSFDIYGVGDCIKVVLVGRVPWNGSFGDFVPLIAKGEPTLPFQYLPKPLLGYCEKVEQ